MAGSLYPGGLIAIRDFVRGLSKGAALFGVNMLVNTELETPTPKGSTEGGSVQQALRESKCFPYPSEIPISSSRASQNEHNRVSRLEPRGFEPLTSAVQRR